MATLKIHKTITIPTSFEPNTLYLVRAGTDRFSIYLTDKDGLVLFKSPDSSDISTVVLTLINALKGQPGGLASLNLDGYIEQPYASIQALDGQDGDLSSNGNLIWSIVDNPIHKLSVLADVSASDPTRIVTFNGMQGWLFAPSILTQVFPRLQVPYNYQVGTEGHINIHWMPGSGAIGDVRWGIEYSVMKSFSQGAFPATTIAYATQFVDSTVDLIRNYTTELATIPSAQLEPGSTIMMRIFRDGGNILDTFLGNTSPYKVSLNYQCKRIGTRQRQPDFYI